MSTIELNSMVTAPVTDSEGEASFIIGKLIAINSRIATIEQSDGTITKVGKTKIEPMKEVKEPKPKTPTGQCSECGESHGVFDYNHVKGRAAAKDAPYKLMAQRFWCNNCDHSWGGKVRRNEGGESIIDHTKHNYEVVTAASGRKSLDNGDEAAKLLRGKTLIEVYHIASEITGLTVMTLMDSYQHLNAGQQRMVLGNRIRKILNNRANGIADTPIV